MRKTLYITIIIVITVTTASVSLFSAAAFGMSVTSDTPEKRTGSEEKSGYDIIRYGGRTRYDTARIIAETGFEESGHIVIASGSSYADALAGAPLAEALKAPIYLVSGDTLDPKIEQSIYDMHGKYIYILGGESAVSKGIERQLTGKGYTVTRIGGSTRYETSVLIALKMADILGTMPSDIFFASGTNFPDALAASPIAGRSGSPIIYVIKSGKLSESAKDFVRASGKGTAYILGGENAIGKDVRTELEKCGYSKIIRLGGQTRYDTAYEILKHFRYEFEESDNISFATGENYPDALAGSALSYRLNAPLILVNNKTVHTGTASILSSFEVKSVHVYGGINAVSDNIVHRYLGRDTDHSSGTTSTTAKVTEDTTIKPTDTTGTSAATATGPAVTPDAWPSSAEMDTVIRDVSLYCGKIGMIFEPALDETNCGYWSTATQLGTGPYPSREAYTEALCEIILFEKTLDGYEYVNVKYRVEASGTDTYYISTVYFG